MTSTAPYYNQPQDHDFPNVQSDTHHSGLDRVAMYNRTTNENNRRAATYWPLIQQSKQQQPIDANLLQAVTSAAGEESALDQVGGTPEEQHPPRRVTVTRQSKIAEEAVSLLSPSIRKAKRKRECEIQQERRRSQENQLEFRNYRLPDSPQPSGKKRRKDNSGVSPEQSPGITDAPTHGSNGAEDADASFFVNEYPPALSMSDARAAGVYSAAALFRKPTSSSKKYTRPPMSKLFTSLELTPENFLRLQASAKSYMLDAAHPERQSCVGNRGKGDSDMVKLKLYHCVEEFLERDGIAEAYFGQSSEGVSRRKWSWPADVNKVISLVTPLCRRMVTNERQRQYAVESRRGGPKEKNGREEWDAAQPNAGADEILRAVQKKQGVAEQLDPALTSGTQNGYHTRVSAPDPHLDLRFVFVRADSRQLAARSFTSAADACKDYATLVKLVEGVVRAHDHEDETRVDDAIPPGQVDGSNVMTGSASPRLEAGRGRLGKIRISAFLPSRGAVPVRNEGEWSASQEEARHCVWLEGELRVIVQLG